MSYAIVNVYDYGDWDGTKRSTPDTVHAIAVRCDGCGKTFHRNGETLFGSVTDAKRAMAALEWHWFGRPNGETVHYCPECWEEV